MYREKIGIVGGFGAYATLNFYQRILESFGSDSERNYPHIIMDNNFTMPSRTRALLYDECYDEVVQGIADSLRMLSEQGADRMILVCGTAHYFLEDVYKIIPQVQQKVMDMIHILGEELRESGQKEALVIAAEGALLKELYPKRLANYQICCESPSQAHYEKIRYFIESVKRNQMTRKTAWEFFGFLEEFKAKNVILGCTEFPVLVKYVSGVLEGSVLTEWNQYQFWDPLETTIDRLKRTLS